VGEIVHFLPLIDNFSLHEPISNNVTIASLVTLIEGQRRSKGRPRGIRINGTVGPCNSGRKKLKIPFYIF